MSERLSGKVAIVTGAASGIGAASAELMAHEGATVVVADINLDGAEAHADAICKSGAKADAIRFDLADPDSIRNLIDATVRRHGGFDVLYNNAADTRLSSTRDTVVEHVEIDVWDQLMVTTLRGPMIATKFAIPHLRARGGGSIIFTASGAGIGGSTGPTAYGVAKAGVISLMQNVATQHGKENIRCNAIAPGTIQTPALDPETFGSGAVLDIMLNNTLTTRLGLPEDIAWTAVWLASDESAFVTGQCICVDGGLLAHHPYWSEFRALATKDAP